MFALLGWCYYSLKEYDEAVRLYLEALDLTNDLIATNFDLALALLCNKRVNLALKEYKKALDMIKNQQPMRRQSLLNVALRDLKDALEETHLSELETVKEAAQEVIKMFSSARIDAVKDNRSEIISQSVA